MKAKIGLQFQIHVPSTVNKFPIDVVEQIWHVCPPMEDFCIFWLYLIIEFSVHLRSFWYLQTLNK